MNHITFMTRAEALKLGLSQYFTGKPCKHGHIAHRYATSGSCAQCVSEAAIAWRKELRNAVPRVRARQAEQRADVIAAAVAARASRDDALRYLQEVRLLVDLRDMDDVFELAVCLCLIDYPALARRDVEPARQPIKAGIPIYRVKVPIDQVPYIREYSDALWNARQSHAFIGHAERVAAQVSRQADDDGEDREPPESYK